MPDSFVHLHTHTEYSMLDGASRIDDLFAEAARMGMPALAITDHGVMYGALAFYQAGQRHGVKPILGTELYVATRTRFDKNARERDGNHHMTAIAATTEGYRNLMRLVTQAHLEGYYFRPRVDKALLAEHGAGIIATTGCLGGEVCQLILADQTDLALRAVGEYQEIFGRENFYVELQDHGLEEQRKVMPALLDIAKRTAAPLLATNDLHYTRRGDAEAHDALLCIQTGATISDTDRFRFEGQEFYLKSPQEMRALFDEYPEACDNTLLVAERCSTEVHFGENRLPKFETPTGEPVDAYLRRMTMEGAARRYGATLSAEVRERIEYELSVIGSMGFQEYFLIVADLIHFAKTNGVRVGPGRGSAAGSVVSYCLGIVDVDPLRWGLIFERFLNPGRKEMPDIDMDFDDRRRGDVIRYATEKYGADHVAQIVTFSTIKGKQAIRDSARVLGYPYGVGDRLARMYPPSILGKDPPLVACFDRDYEWPDAGSRSNDAYPNATDLRTAYETDADSKRVIDTARQLEGLRRQAGVHAAGVVISDVPLVDVVPLWRSEHVGSIVTQYEMNTVAALGLLKMDFLGLRNLTVIEDCLAHLRARGVDLDVDAVPLDDADTYALLSRGDTVGVFQLENQGMRDLVRRLLPDRFEEVMALVALYRPGPLGANMHIEFANRKHGTSKIEYPHPDLEPTLRETYGIILYQEQVIRIAVDIAGFTPAEAESFRKAMGKKKAEVMAEQNDKFISGCVGNGYERALAQRLWDMIEHFSGYGFNKSHSCCYALIAYQTAYLKARYPVEYMAALLTSVKDNRDRRPLYLAEAREMSITVELPDVNVSDLDFTPTDKGTIRYGLSAVRNVGENVVEKIMDARRARGGFSSFVDFCKSVDPIVLNRRVIESLAKAGAFDSLDVTRSQLLQPDVEKGLVLSDAAATLVDGFVGEARAKAAGQDSLFDAEPAVAADVHVQLPEVPPLPQDLLLAAEKDMLGTYVSDHPLFAVEAALKAVTDRGCADVANMREGDVVTVGGLVTRLQKRFTRKGEPMAVIALEDLNGSVQVVVFPGAYVTAQSVLIPDAIVCVKGKVDTREDQPQLIAEEVFVPTLDGGGAPLVLSLQAEAFSDSLVSKLKDVLSNHPGPTPVHLRVTSRAGTKKYKLAHSFNVERRPGLYAELKVLLGPKVLD